MTNGVKRHARYSISCVVYPGHRIIALTVTGYACLDTLMELHEVIVNHPDYDREYQGVVDWRSSLAALTREDVKQLASRTLKYPLSSTATWVAIVDAPDLTAYATMFKNDISSQHPVEVCCTEKRASEILGIDIATLLPT